jgi:hypothetical protein
MPNDQRRAGDRFKSIAGVTDFTFNEFELEPRDDGDVVQ